MTGVPIEGIRHRWQRAARRLPAWSMPGLLALSVVLLGGLWPWTASDLLPSPHWLLILAFQWSIHRPQAMPPLLLAGFGLLQDLVWGGPLGANLLLLLIVQAILFDERRILRKLAPAQTVLVFAVVVLVYELLLHLLAGLYWGASPPWRPFLLQAAETLLAYPFVVLLLVRLERALFGPRWKGRRG